MTNRFSRAAFLAISFSSRGEFIKLRDTTAESSGVRLSAGRSVGWVTIITTTHSNAHAQAGMAGKKWRELRLVPKEEFEDFLVRCPRLLAATCNAANLDGYGRRRSER